MVAESKHAPGRIAPNQYDELWNDTNPSKRVAEARGPGDAMRLAACWNACEGIPDPEKTIPAMREALRGLLYVIDAAGLENLSRGVELGSISWYHKASDWVDCAREALRLAEGGKS